MAAQLQDLLAAERLGITGKITVGDVLDLLTPEPMVIPVNGRFNIDNQADDLTGYGLLGTYYTITGDLGGIASTNLNRTAGGFKFPFDVQIKRFNLDFYQSTNTMGITDWGWLISRVNRSTPGNVVSTTFVYDERTTGVLSSLDSSWTGADGDNRQYGSTQTQNVDIDLSSIAESTVPAGEVINLALFQNGTADANNRYIYGLSGYLEIQRV